MKCICAKYYFIIFLCGVSTPGGENFTKKIVPLLLTRGTSLLIFSLFVCAFLIYQIFYPLEHLFDQLIDLQNYNVMIFLISIYLISILLVF